MFAYGDVEEIEFNNPDIYAYKKSLNGDRILVILNFSNTILEFSVDEKLDTSKILINNYDQLIVKDSIIDLQPYQGVILEI